MNKLTADEKKKLTTGVIVAALLGFVAFKFFQGDGVFSSSGGTYSTPLGDGSVGQIVVSLLISVGGAVLTVGADLLKKWLGWQTGPGAAVIDAARDKLLEALKELSTLSVEARYAKPADVTITRSTVLSEADALDAARDKLLESLDALEAGVRSAR